MSIAITGASGKLGKLILKQLRQTIVHREDSSIQSWIYGYLSKLNTTSTTEDLETLIGGPATSLKESILPLIPSNAG